MLEQLRSIDVSNNRFSSYISKAILALPQLDHLNVSFNQLIAIEVNNSLASGIPLRVLDAQRNHLQGHLPVKFGQLWELSSNNLAHNGLTAQIPMAYGQRDWGAHREPCRLPPQFNNSMVRIRGSLANNYLRCAVNIPLCKGGQRPASGCISQRVTIEK
ncbi:hypothetical protein CRYUN_Cryun29cG0016000 [Craigia yunnanensis]